MSSITATPSNTALRFVPAIAWMGLIYVLSDQPRLPRVGGVSVELTSILGHFFVYLVLAALLWWALGALDISPRQRALLAFGGAVLYGLTDEWHQSFVPGRTPDVLDLATDAIGAAIGVLLVQRLARSERAGHLLR
jgi:VanZ family protein